jgi:tRNA (mo5U34)-methyltransferase
LIERPQLQTAMATLSQAILHHWIRERIENASWYHTFEVWPGIVTPGVRELNAPRLLDEAGVPADLSGKRALDIGTWDGPVAFELERRGASVVALDIQDPDETGFNAAREIRQSRVQYVRGSVYELSRLVCGRFDVICYLGVFYHLKDPVTAFEQICAALEPDGQVLFEGECLRDYAETLEGDPVRGKLVGDVADSALPLALCAPGQFKERPNYFIPNLAGLRSWAKAGGLEIVRHAFTEAPECRPFPTQRVWGVAVKLPPALSVEKVTQEGSTIFVAGSGFARETAINLFCKDGARTINLGGLDPDGKPLIPLTVHSPSLVSFRLPRKFRPGPAYVQALNPPYFDNVNSGVGPAGAFELRDAGVNAAVAPTVEGVRQQGSTIVVTGSGFTHQTAINLFCDQHGVQINLGGLDAQDAPLIPVTIHSPTLLSFTVPEGAPAGPAYLQALNPPFTDNFNSGTGPGGSFELRAL